MHSYQQELIDLRAQLEKALQRTEALMARAGIRTGDKIDRIMGEVAREHGLTVGEMLGPNRMSHIALPRQISMALCRELLGSDYRFIASRHKKGDHATAIYAKQAVMGRYDTDSKFKERFDRLRNTCQQLLQEMEPSWTPCSQSPSPTS